MYSVRMFPVAALLATCAVSTIANAQGVLIPVPDRRDHVYDPVRDVLYITTTNGTVERWDVVSGRLLEPFSVGLSLNGLDITPDASSLYVAEDFIGATQGFVRKIDLDTGDVTNLTYDLDFFEGGAWDIAIGPNGKGLVTTQFQGSGWVPLRELNLASDQLIVRTDVPGSDVRQNTQVTRGGDRSLIFLTESNISSGPIHTYDATIDSFPSTSTTSAFLGNASSSVSRDGSMIALELGVISILNTDLGTIEILTSGSGGVIFDPAIDVLYAADSSTNEIIARDTTSWDVLYMLPVGENVSTSTVFDNGELSISPDGDHLFISTNLGVRMLDLPVQCVGDIAPRGGNDVVGPGDLAQLLGAWGPNPGDPADLDGNGVVDAADLAQLLGAWGSCA